jgi:alpha-methylacyl-CoA racemase
MSEATNEQHIKARNTIIERDGVPQPAPAPRFSRTAAEVERSAPWPGQQTDEALADWGVEATDIAKLRETGAIA